MSRRRDSLKKGMVAAVVALEMMALMPLNVLAASAPVRVAGSQVFALSASAGGMTPEQRAVTIQKNLDNALVASQDRSPNTVKIVYVKGQPVITVGGFYVATVDAASAKAAGTTPALLAQRWVEALKASLKDSSTVGSYVAQLSGSGNTTTGTATTDAGTFSYYKQGRIVYIPAGMTLPVKLTTALSSDSTKEGDVVHAQISQNVNLGDTSIPEGSLVLGKVTQSTAGTRMGKSGRLGIQFHTLRTPDGVETPITAHITGNIGTYEQVSENTVRGETVSNKVKQALVRGAIGAGGGAVLGTAIGAIAGSGRGAGRGAIAGTAIGAGLGVAESLLLRKGADVKMASGQSLKLQLDAPASLAVTSGTI